MLTDWTALPVSELETKIADEAQALMAALQRNGEMLATAESCTGGLISGAMTEIPGSSAVFERGWATYSNAAKAEELDVDPDLIVEHGAVSAPVAEAMARGAAIAAGAALALSVTGVAGPSGSEAKPVGLVYFGACWRGATQMVERRFGERPRAEIRRLSVLTALELGRATLEG